MKEQVPPVFTLFPNLAKSCGFIKGINCHDPTLEIIDKDRSSVSASRHLAK